SGHAYRTTSEAEAARVAEEERSIMVGFAGRLREQGVPVREVSVGSTPAMAAVLDLAGVTEARPGNYVFYDRTMVLIGCCESAAELEGRYKVGSRLELVPNHSCLAVAQFDVYHVVRGTGDEARVVDRWKVERGR